MRLSRKPSPSSWRLCGNGWRSANANLRGVSTGFVENVKLIGADHEQEVPTHSNNLETLIESARKEEEEQKNNINSLLKFQSNFYLTHPDLLPLVTECVLHVPVKLEALIESSGREEDQKNHINFVKQRCRKHNRRTTNYPWLVPEL